MTRQLEMSLAAEPTRPEAREWERRQEIRYRAAQDFERHYETRVRKVPLNPDNPCDVRRLYELTDANGKVRRFESMIDAEKFLRRELRGNYQFTPSLFSGAAS